MKIVLSGYYGFDNVGDEAILLSIIQALKEKDKVIDIIVLSNQPAKTEATYGVHAVNRWDFKQVFNALKEADGLISGGGSLLQDETGFKSIPYYTGIIKLAQLLRKPVFVYAQGMGPIKSGLNRKIVKNVLKRTKITVRDTDSKKLLEDIGIKNEISIVPDPVLGLTLNQQHSKWWEEQSFQSPVITVSVRDWPSEIDFKKKIAQALDLAASDGATIVFVPMHGHHDDEASREVANLMDRKSFIAPYDTSIEEKIVMIGKSNLLVGMRLHALIFSSIMETPFIGLSYDPKIDAFADISGQPVAGHVNKQGWDEDTLYVQIKENLEFNEEAKMKLHQKINPLRDKAKETAQKAIDLFKKDS